MPIRRLRARLYIWSMFGRGEDGESIDHMGSYAMGAVRSVE